MPSYNLVDGGVVTPGLIRFHSFSETAQAGELGQIIRFVGFPFTKQQLYGIRKSGLPYVGGGTVEDFPIIGGSDMALWSPSTFVPVSQYVPGASTMLFFPRNIGVPPGTTYRLYRVLQ